MLTEAQRIIIQEVCNIQFQSLSDILTKVDLGNDLEGENYERIFKEIGFERKDFDRELIKVINNFKEVKDDPEKIYMLDDLDMIVFKHILHNFRGNWESRFPKALMNLWDKLIVLSFTNNNIPKISLYENSKN